MESNYDNLKVDAMMARQQWVLWKNINRDGMPSKVPFSPTGKRAKVNDPSTWSSYGECVRNVTWYEGIGFVFTSKDPFVGIDLDGCRDPETGDVADWAQGLINLTDSYTEVSPSGTGVKIFVRGEWPHGGQKKTLHETKVCEKTPGVEVYAEKRYFAVTGERISERAVDAEDRQEVLDWICNKYFADRRPDVTTAANGSVRVGGDEAKVVERARRYVAKMPPAISGERGHDATFSVACVLVLGFGLKEEDAMPILLAYNQRCQPQWSEGELRHKLKDAAKQPGQRNYLRNSALDFGGSPAASRSIRMGAIEADFQAADMKSLVSRLIDNLEIRGEVPKVSIGIKGVDRVLGGGLNFGDLVLLGGLSSHLKSGLAQQIGHHITKSGLPFAFVSLEMSLKVLAERTLQFASAEPRENWANSTTGLRWDAQRHFQGASDFHTIEAEADPATVLQSVQRLFKDNVKVIVVDYLQLATAGSGDQQHLVLGDLAKRLKHLARTHGGIVIGLAQLRKDLEKRRPVIPMLSDFEYGARLGQTADVCLLGLWRHRIDPRRRKDEYQVFVAKNRNGESGACVNCRIEPARLRIMEDRSDFRVGERSHQPTRPELARFDTFNGQPGRAKAC